MFEVGTHTIPVGGAEGGNKARAQARGMGISKGCTQREESLGHLLTGARCT